MNFGAKVTSSSFCAIEVNGAKQGEILCINKDGLTVACKDRAILIKKVKPESKGKMCACDFANGKRLKKGDIL